MTEAKLSTDLFGREEIQKPTAQSPRSIAEMHWCYGVTPGRRCRDCRFLVLHQPGANRYAKCSKASITSGPATDWRLRWEACGLFLEAEDPRKKGGR